MTSVLNYLTGSKYCGNFIHNTTFMDGFGVYTYPNGSEYRGFFKNGEFHGYGVLRVVGPRKYLYRGHFKHGRLIKIEDILFDDGLRMACELQGSKVDTQDWKYIIPYDRRFAKEIATDIKAVGPNAHLTNMHPPRNIPPSYYDMEEALYNPSSGFAGDILYEDPIYYTFKSHFVHCLAEKNWIRKYCRRGNEVLLPEEVEINFQREIISNNLNYLHTETCNCNLLQERKKMFLIYSKRQNDEKSELVDDPCAKEDGKKIIDLPTAFVRTPTSSSCPSLSEKTLNVDILVDCVDENTTAKIKSKTKNYIRNKKLLTREYGSYFDPARLSDISRYSKIMRLAEDEFVAGHLK